MDRKEFKSKPQHLVTDSRTGEILRIVNPSNTEIGTKQFPSDFLVTGDSLIQGDLTTQGNLSASLSASLQGVTTIKDLMVTGLVFGPSSYVPMFNGGRLQLTSSLGISTGSIVSGSTVFYMPHVSNQITLYDGNSWRLCNFTSASLSLTGLTIDKNYDVFALLGSGSIALQWGTAWTSNSARAIALTSFDGVSVDANNSKRRYIGTIRTTSNSTTEDSTSKRFVWNYYNQVPRTLFVTDTTTSWSYAVTNTWRQAREDAANKVEYVSGETCAVDATVCVMVSNTQASHSRAGIGINS